MIVIADASKRVETLGKFPLPLEVVPFGLTATHNMIVAPLPADAGCEGEITVRKHANGKPYLTDSGNYILECAFGSIPHPEDLDEALKLIPGVVENGLFMGLPILRSSPGLTASKSCIPSRVEHSFICLHCAG